MRIFITGGCGFIGSNMAEYHLNKGDEVHVVDDLSAGSLHNIASFQDNPAFKFSHANLINWDGLAEAVQWADRIYHFAAIVGVFKAISSPIDIVSSNIIGCQQLLQTISQTTARPIVIIACSSAVYGENPNHLLNEEDNLIMKPPYHPLGPYSISKLTDEIIALAYLKSSGIPVILPRIFNTIGPRQTGLYGMVVPRFVQQACSNEPITIFGDGTQTRSFCDVRDTIVALDMLAAKPEAIGQIINVGNDSDVTINQLAQLVTKCLGRDTRTRYIPYSEAYGVAFTDITQRKPDLSKLFKFVPFKHQWTLEKTIQDLVSRKLKE